MWFLPGMGEQELYSFDGPLMDDRFEGVCPQIWQVEIRIQFFIKFSNNASVKVTQ